MSVNISVLTCASCVCVAQGDSCIGIYCTQLECPQIDFYDCVLLDLDEYCLLFLVRYVVIMLCIRNVVLN